MRRLALTVVTVAAALAVVGCSDGYKPVDVPGLSAESFAVWDDDTSSDSVDYGMALRACESVDQVVAAVIETGEADALVVCGVLR